MRLTTLLDTLNNGGSGPWPPLTITDAPTPGTGTGLDLDADFDQVISSLIPCRRNDAELWFAEREAEVEQAKALCRSCPVRQGCLEGALERREPWGVWGGEVFVDGAIVARKRGRGRPRKQEVA